MRDIPVSSVFSYSCEAERYIHTLRLQANMNAYSWDLGKLDEELLKLTS